MLDLPQLRDLLQPIVGEPLSGMCRSLGQVFEFGEQRPDTNRRGEAITRGDFLLKFIAADWRVVQAGTVVIGSSDHTNKAGFFDSDEPPGNPYDVEARRLGRDFLTGVEECRFVVESVDVGPYADVTIHLTNDLRFQSFGSSGQDFDLWWFHNLRTDVSCLVGPSGQNMGRAAGR